MRIASDSMGEMSIPEERHFGAQSERARVNFPISDLRIPEKLRKAIAGIKLAAARVNQRAGLISGDMAQALEQSCQEIMGDWDPEDFPVDVFQTGSGTSWNMNLNEVIASRANEILGGAKGSRSPIHPNDHVNRGQSSNDVIPTAINISNLLALQELLNSLGLLVDEIRKKSREFDGIIKIGRTHLQDAVPMTLGQEFGAFASTLEKVRTQLDECQGVLQELPQGGTALGTGLNAPKGFGVEMAQELGAIFGQSFFASGDFFETIANRSAQVQLMGAMNSLAVALMKIGNDLRLLSSGPRTGLAEITLPALQPGSSIMPGKINPVIPEMLIQGAARIMGAHATVSVGAQNAPLQLNIMMPLIAYETNFSLEIASNMCRSLAEKCIRGIQANEEECRRKVENSLAMVTPLALEIGYDKASKLAYRAFHEGKTVRELALEEKILDRSRLEELLNPKKMI